MRSEVLAWGAVRRLSELPRGADEVLAHLFLGGPQTLDDLRATMIADRQAMQERRRPEEYEYELPVDRMVDHSLLYDVGQLAQLGVIEAGAGGVIEVAAYYREAVRVFLRAAFPHRADMSRALISQVRGCTREAPLP